MQKLLIADTSEEFCASVAEILCDSFDIRLCSEGNRALELMRSFRPDIVFLDVTLPGLDGATVLETAVSEGIDPVVLAAVSHLSDYLSFSLNRLGVGFVVRKPYMPKVIANRLVDMRNETCRVHNNPIMAEDPIKRILVDLGIRTNRAGYECLYASLEIAQRDPGQAITKMIYPAVAAKCGGNSNRVEKAMRDVIKQAWDNRNDRIWQRYFPEYCNKNECPKNREFISLIAAYLLHGEMVTELCGRELVRGA